MTESTCTAPDCTEARYGRKDYCRKHQARIDRNGTLETKPRGPQPKNRGCAHDGCDRPHKGLGYCAKHLEQMRVAGIIEDTRDRCAFKGCQHPHRARGLCQAHDRQMRNGGVLTPLQVKTKRPDACQAKDCSNEVLAKGYCNTHYWRLRNGKDIDAPLTEYKPKGGECSVTVCNREATVEGMCQTHRRRYLDGAQPGWDDPIPDKAPNGSGHKDKNGYVHVSVNGKQRRQHHVFMEELLGRPLFKHENVHHVNGVRDDNRTDGPLRVVDGKLRSGNLELWSTAQPAGQSVVDKVAYAREILALYGDLVPEQ